MSTSSTHETVAFLDVVFPPPRPFDIRLWDGEVLSAGGDVAFTLVLKSPGSLRRMFQVPVELSLGEAYLRGDFDVEGDLVAAFAIPSLTHEAAQSARGAASLMLHWLRLPRTDDEASNEVHDPADLAGSEHSRERDQAAIQYHYDVGNDFYRLFLDSRMMYSCAYFRSPALDLEAAQEAKLEHIGRKLRLRPGERLLDVGCGWGGLLIYMAQKFGVTGAGVTLSAAQYELATERVAEAGLADRVRIELRDYRDLSGESFDKVVSVGMFEHVGRDHFAEYFNHIFRLLRPDGLFLNHHISHQAEVSAADAGVSGSGGGSGGAGLLSNALDRLVIGRETFRKRYIFPDGELAPVSAANLQAELSGFEVRDVENLREHYALTLRWWLDRLRAQREAAVELAGDAVFRLWEMYLAASIYHFEIGRISINQTLFARPENGRVTIPMTRADLYEY
jgi:cyclopropane-fatty-acyl-phospholipid synthase